MYWIALFGLLQLIQSVHAQNLPREIEEGLDGNIVINLGGIPDPNAPFYSPGIAILRARSRGVATHKLDESKKDAKPSGSASEETEEEYDYASYTTKPAQTTMKRMRKPQQAKNSRLSLLEWLGWTGKATQGKKTPSDQRSLAFGANSAEQLFGKQPNGPLSTIASAQPLVKLNHASSTGQGPQLQLKRLSSKALSCKNWRDFHKTTRLLTARRSSLVQGSVKKPDESTASLGIFDQSQSSLAVLGPATTNSELLPLAECYTNNGMPCCNRVLEEMIYRTNDAMINANINKCNTESYAQTLRNLLEKQFQTTFEIIVSTEDFAAKIRFRENLLCKTIVNEKIVLAYASPEPYALLPYNVEGSLTV